MSRKHEGNQTNEAQNVTISTLPSQSSTYNIQAQVGQKFVSLIVDTGAAVTLIRSDVWGQGPKCKLSPWTGGKLVGANGTELHVLGKKETQLTLQGRQFPVSIVIVESLTSEGILDLDFLERHHCIINSASGQLLFPDCDLCIPLKKQGSKSPIPTQQVLACLHLTVIVPP